MTFFFTVLSLIIQIGIGNSDKPTFGKIVCPEYRCMSRAPVQVFVRDNETNVHLGKNSIYGLRFITCVKVVKDTDGFSGSRLNSHFQIGTEKKNWRNVRFCCAVSLKNKFWHNFDDYGGTTASVFEIKHNIGFASGNGDKPTLNVSYRYFGAVRSDKFFSAKINAFPSEVSLPIAGNPECSSEESNRQSGQKAKKSIVTINQPDAANSLAGDNIGDDEGFLVGVFGGLLAGYIAYAFTKAGCDIVFRDKKDRDGNA